jgi:hypothetical protein
MPIRRALSRRHADRDAGNQGGCNQGANAGDRFKASAQFIRPVPGKDTSVSLEDLPLHEHELSLQCPQAFLCGGRETLIHPSVDQQEQPLYTVAADTGDDAKLG